MTKLTKKKKQLLELVNPETTYSLDEAMTIFQTVKSPKFDESIDISMKINLKQIYLLYLKVVKLYCIIKQVNITSSVVIQIWMI